MAEIVMQTFPSGISPEALAQLLDDIRNRENVLRGIVQRFEQRYGVSLEALETRLARGEGCEHPDWEDSIEWRNAVEALQRNQVMRRVLEWLLRSIAPSP